MQLGDGLAEDAVVPRVHVADAVGADERSTITVDGLKDAVLQHCPFVRLLAKAGRKDDEGAHVLLGGQCFHGVGTQSRRDGQHGQVGVGDGRHIGVSLDALHFLLLGVDRTQLTCIAAADEVLQNGPSGLVYIVGRTHHNDAHGVQQFIIDHSRSVISFILHKYTLFIQTSNTLPALLHKKSDDPYLTGKESIVFPTRKGCFPMKKTAFLYFYLTTVHQSRLSWLCDTYSNWVLKRMSQSMPSTAVTSTT